MGAALGEDGPLDGRAADRARFSGALKDPMPFLEVAWLAIGTRVILQIAAPQAAAA